jgi:hypothetical protein
MIIFLLQRLRKSSKLPAMNPPGDPMLAFKLLPYKLSDNIIMLLLFFLRPLQRDWIEIL